MGDEEDPVIQEIPVFLSKTLASDLYVFQYPLQPNNGDWDNVNVLSCKVKPIHQEIKLEVGLDTSSKRYSSSKGEQIALNTDGSKSSMLYNREKEKSSYFKSGVMDKLVYESNIPVSDPSKYAVAILQDGEMHFTPVNGIVQLRPSYSYFDKQDKRLKEEEREKNMDDEEASVSTDVEAKPITVTFARTENDRMKMAREKSFGYISKKSAEEPWLDAMWCHSNSDKAELERMKLFASSSNVDMGLNLPVSDYLSTLVPVDEEMKEVVPDHPSDFIHLNLLKKMPLVDQCKIILKDAKLVTVCWLSSIVGVGGAPLLQALCAAGRLVRGGRWAVRSDVLYPQGSLSKSAGLPHTVMCRARDYALYLFTQSDHIDRRKFTAAVKLPPEEVKEILSSVAKMQPNKGWELLIPPDLEFETKYPDIEQRQALFWEARQRQFNEMLSGEPATPKRQRKKSQRDSVSSDSGLCSPKVRSNSISHNSNHVRDSVSSDNESGSDSKIKNKKNASVKRTNSVNDKYHIA